MSNISVLTEKAFSKLEKSLGKLIQAKYHKTRLPFVTLKFAQTLDGKIATLTGDSRWISGPSSLRFAHQMRCFHDAVLVGVGTIIRDDPKLTVRLFEGKNPQKIIVDSHLRTPINANVLKGKEANSTIIATTSITDPGKIKPYQSKGAEVWVVKKDSSSQVDLKSLLKELGRRNFHSVLVEGGSKIISSFFKNRLADHLIVVIAPKIIGRGINCVNIPAKQGIENYISPSSLRYFRSGDDIILSVTTKK